MKIDKEVIKSQIKVADEAGYLEIRDHRGNILILHNGEFSINDCIQLKTKKARDSILLESFKLSRFVKINNQGYLRKGRRWIESGKSNSKDKTK